ncbi:hypothetical protein FACS189434_13510 [Bacteroidia bacterium]|nr:hypothetical protein FACS189434_13510 [Bacteroidia bacterium]
MSTKSDSILIATSIYDTDDVKAELKVIIPQYDIYWDRNGNEMFRNPNKENKDRTYIVRTDNNQEKLYKNSNIPDNEKVAVRNITTNQAKATEKQIIALKKETDKSKITQILASNAQHFVQIENLDILVQIYNHAQNDTGREETCDARNREYGAIIYKTDKVELVTGDVGNPEVNTEISVTYSYRVGTVRTTAHTHPSGKITRYYIDGAEVDSHTYNNRLAIDNRARETGTKAWRQLPSRQDIRNADNVHYVFAMDKKILV